METWQKDVKLFDAKIKEELAGVLKRAKKNGHSLDGIADVVFERIAERFEVSLEFIHKLKMEVWKTV